MCLGVKDSCCSCVSESHRHRLQTVESFCASAPLHVHKRFLHSALFSQALFVTSSLLHQVNKPTLLISKIVANKNAVESEMHVPASSDFVTEVKVPQADPPALRCLSTLYRHPVVEAGLCSPVTHALFLFYRICLIS